MAVDRVWAGSSRVNAEKSGSFSKLNGNRRRVALLGMVAASVALTGCKPTANAADISCFPAESRQWIARTASPATAVNGDAVPAATLKSAVVYVDRSASMIGYLAGSSAMNQPFKDVVSTFPESLRQLGIETRFRAFGRNVTTPTRDGSAMLDPAFYSCVDRAKDEACESHLDTVLAAVARQPDQLAVVVSDLWFSNSSVDSSALAALQPALRDILKDRAIAVYGIPAPFNGKIYDLPAAPGQPTVLPHAGTHPLYVLVIGPDADVQAFDNRLKGSGSPGIAAGVAEGGPYRRAIFTAFPTRQSQISAEPLTAGNSPMLRVRGTEVYRGLTVQQFAYDPEGNRPSRTDGDSLNLASWTGPDPSLFVPNSVWQGPTSLRVRVWRRRDDQCRATSWVEMSGLPGPWPPVEPGGRHDFRLTPNRIRQAFRQEGTYVITGEMQRVSVMQNNPQTAWMTQWSLPLSGGGYAAPAGSLFPTLNINEFGRIIQDALADATKAQSRPVTGFTVMVHSGDD